MHDVLVSHEIFMTKKGIFIFVKAFLSLFVECFCLAQSTELNVLFISELESGARLSILLINEIFWF